MQDKIKRLAEEHWSYIEKLLDVTLSTESEYDIDKIIAMCRFHYITAWEHGAKHYAEMLEQGKEIKETQEHYFNFNFDNPLFRKWIEESENNK